MNKNNRNNEQIYGRNDMIMLDQNNKIYGSLGLADKYVMKTEEGTRLTLRNPKLGSFANVLTEFNMYGRSEQKQYKGINLFPPNTRRSDFVEVSIPKGSSVFWVTDGTPVTGGNFRFFNEDKTENSWFGVDAGSTSKRMTLTIDVKYVQNLLDDFDQSKICLGAGTEPIYEPYVGGKPSPSPDYPQEIKSVVNPTVKVTNEDETQFETANLTYTLNAIPVSSGGNYTDQRGQQWIADYVDLERGKVVRKIGKLILTGKENWMLGFENWKTYPHAFRAEELKKDILIGNAMNAKYPWYQKKANQDLNSMNVPYDRCIAVSDARFSSVDEFTNELKKQNSNGTPLIAYYVTDTPQEENLSFEEIEQYKKLSIRTPTTIVENNYNTWMRATYKSTESV